MSVGFGDVALLGLGASTQAAASYLLGLPKEEVRSLTVYAGASSSAGRLRGEALEAAGAQVIWDTQELQGAYDLGIVSPGIPATGAFYQSGQRACGEVVSEPEIAWRESPRNWIAITGTNGKTTTTTLTTALLNHAGIVARAVGNIGLPPIACIGDRQEGEVFVAELSSFQLQSVRHFAPRVAVLLNITPDHVEWHGSLEAYAKAKERVFAAMGPQDLCVLGTDDLCQAIAGRLCDRGLRVLMLGEKPCACVADGAWVNERNCLTVRLGGREHELCAVDELAIRGPHNVQNALAASVSALALGALPEAVAAGLRAFRPLAHRVEPCGVVGGVHFVDDSKATNVDAALRALEAFEPGRIVLMLGGHDKGTDLKGLASQALRRCRTVVAYGEAGERLEAALVEAAGADTDPMAHIERAAGMAEAFEVACAAAMPGDTVLLSPACSSYDEFSGFEERGDTFKAWVAQRGGAVGC